jgi:hypothetical protein
MSNAFCRRALQPIEINILLTGTQPAVPLGIYRTTGIQMIRKFTASIMLGSLIAVSAVAHATQSFSGYDTAELMRLRPQMGYWDQADKDAYRNEMRNRMQSLSPDERAAVRSEAARGSGRGNGQGGGRSGEGARGSGNGKHYATSNDGTPRGQGQGLGYGRGGGRH